MNPQFIFVAQDTSIRGPFTDGEPLAGETQITLTDAQVASLEALRDAHIGAPIVFDGAAFALSQGERIRLALIAILNAQPPGVQSFFAASATDVRTLLQTGAGQIAAAKALVASVPLFGDAGLTAVREQMLAAFP